MTNRRPVFVMACAMALGCLLVGAAPVRAGGVDLPGALGGPLSVRVQSLAERRFATTARQQHDFSCGSAALATLLTHHYDRTTTEQTVFDAMAASGDTEKIRREGFSLLDMKRYLASQGFEADGFEATAAELADAGVPAIALINERGYNHFVVVKGVAGGRVLLGDPAAGTRTTSVEHFEATRANAILFVIGNFRASARFNADADWAAAPASLVAGRFDGSASVSVVWPKAVPLGH